MPVIYEGVVPVVYEGVVPVIYEGVVPAVYECVPFRRRMMATDMVITCLFLQIWVAFNVLFYQ